MADLGALGWELTGVEVAPLIAPYAKPLLQWSKPVVSATRYWFKRPLPAMEEGAVLERAHERD